MNATERNWSGPFEEALFTVFYSVTKIHPVALACPLTVKNKKALQQTIQPSPRRSSSESYSSGSSSCSRSSSASGRNLQLQPEIVQNLQLLPEIILQIELSDVQQG
ncbi:hypothetical protein TNCV_1493481 [Trichonephila clavipes]|nr:hypothetical protein TNCV_1493481 [Trichonephila clavipes]